MSPGIHQFAPELMTFIEIIFDSFPNRLLPQNSLLILCPCLLDNEQGRIHGNPVADRLAGAVMRKPIAI